MVEWIEVQSTDSAQLESLGSQLGVNPLALEDCLHRDQRPKLDDYGDHQLLVWFLFESGRIHELQFLIFKDRLIAVPHDVAPGTKATWKEHLRVTDQQKDVWHMLYQALDRATDITWHDLQSLFGRIDGFEQDLFDREIDPRALLLLKKKLNQIDVSIGLLASVASQLTNLCNPKDDLTWKLRDLHDHCERISKNVGLYRNNIATIIELFWGLQSNRTNRQIKKLSLLASVAVPMTFWASFWGMNFEAIPFASTTLFITALTLMAVSIAFTTWLLIRKGYWSD